MGKRVINPKEVMAAFELYLLHNGERHDLIEREMHRRGWTAFRKSILKSRGFGANRRDGWIDQYGWVGSLETKIATANTVAMTSARSLQFEVEVMRKKIFIEIQASRVGSNRDLVYQHDKYVARSIEILDRLKDACDNYANFSFFFKRLLAAATAVSPALARELVEAEAALIDWAEGEFVTGDSDQHSAISDNFDKF